MNQKLKVINFPEAKKKLERKKFWKDLWNKVVAKFHRKSVSEKYNRKSGFEKYKVVTWGYYKDTNRVWVTVQNIHNGKIATHSLEMWKPDQDEVAFDAVSLFVRKLK